MRLNPNLLRALTILCLAPPASAQVRMTTSKALKLAFPSGLVQRTTVTLAKNKRDAIEKTCGQKFSKTMVFPYVARRNGKLIGTAWFDVHKVRSKKQLLMVVIDPQQKVQRVEILAFAEPPKYAAPKRWLRKLDRQQLGGARAGKEVPRITGATLTVGATTRCVQRVLALHRVVFGPPPAAGSTPLEKPKPTGSKAKEAKRTPR